MLILNKEIIELSKVLFIFIQSKYKKNNTCWFLFRLFWN